MNRAEKARLQLRAVAALRALKRERTYEELAALTGLAANDCSRYVNGHVLPREERARELLGTAREAVAADLRERVRVDEEGYVDTSRVVFDLPFLGVAAPVAAEALGLGEPDVVLTAATDGITTAAALAERFGARCVYAKKDRETAVEEFIEARERLASGVELTYYLPADALAPGEEVVVVDDLIRTGETQTVLLDLAAEAGATVVGVYALVAVGEAGLDRARERAEAVDALVRFEE